MNRRDLTAYARRSGLEDIHPDLLEVGPGGVLYVLDTFANPYRRGDLIEYAKKRVALPQHNPFGATRTPSGTRGAS